MSHPPLLHAALLIAALLLLSLWRRRVRRRGPPLPPGPAGWPVLGFLPKMGPNPHRLFHGLSAKYGPLVHVRLGRVHVVVPSSAAAAEKLLRNDAYFANRPRNSGAEHIAYNSRDIGFLPYGPRWRMQRRLCALHLFSSKAMDEFQDGRRAELGRLVRRLAAGDGEPVDVGREVAACIGNSLSLLLFGRRAFDDGSGADGELRSMVTELMALTGSFCVVDFLPGLSWLDPQGTIGRMKKLNRRFDGFLSKFMEEHRASSRHTKDLLSVLLELQQQMTANDDQEAPHLTDTDIKALLMALYAAGSDSSSILAVWALAEVIRSPGVAARAQAELDAVVGRNRLLSESDIPNLPFLQAVVKETLRLHPPAPLSLPRVAVEDCHVDGYLIPKGATLLLNIWAIGRDPAVWPDDPWAFQPDRFLPGGAHEGVDVKGNFFGLLPFGAGRRMCVGMNLGLRMLSLMTGTLVHSFDWLLPNDQEPESLSMEERSNGLSLLRSEPLVAQPVPRLAPDAYTNS